MDYQSFNRKYMWKCCSWEPSPYQRQQYPFGIVPVDITTGWNAAQMDYHEAKKHIETKQNGI